jgi:hypothetical protein
MWTPPNDPAYWWRLFVQLAEAVATVGVVILALWDKLRGYFYKPKLRFELLDSKDPIKEDPPLNEGDSSSESRSYSCKLVVENTGNAPAIGCSLHLLKCKKKTATDEFIDIEQPISVSSTPWFCINDSQIVLHQHLSRPLTLLTVQQKAQEGPDTPNLESSPIPRKSVLQFPLLHVAGDPLVLDRGEYQLHLAVVDERGRRVELSITVFHSGEWHDRLSKMKEHLSVKERTR